MLYKNSRPETKPEIDNTSYNRYCQNYIYVFSFYKILDKSY